MARVVKEEGPASVDYASVEGLITSWSVMAEQKGCAPIAVYWIVYSAYER